MASKKKNQPATRRAIDKVGDEIRRLWGDIPVRDAVNDLRVMIVEEYLSTATPKDPAHCVFAQACCRVFGSTKVLFYRTVAYIDLPDAKGVMHVERFTMPTSMRALVEAFDRGEKTIPKAGFVLKAPAPSDTLDAIHSTRDRNRKKATERARLQGISVGKESPGSGITGRPITIDVTVRNGTGAVHFIPGKKKGKS